METAHVDGGATHSNAARNRVGQRHSGNINPAPKGMCKIMLDGFLLDDNDLGDTDEN